MSALSREGGFTIPELLTVLVILSIVLSGLTAVFVSGVKAETDMNKRFQAQQDARLALSKLRRELWCAQTAYTTSPDAITIASATASSTPGSFCKAGTYTWCTQAVGGAPNRYGLYREAGPTCGSAGGSRLADHLTSPNVFTLLPEACWSRRLVDVDLRLDLDPADAQRHYRLHDAITMRSSGRVKVIGGVPCP